MNTERPSWILPVIVFSQFTGTSLWFAGNAILPEIQDTFHYGDTALAQLTSVIQFGFIVGTLIFAIFNISDRLSPTKVFLVCSLAGAFSNFLLTIFIEDFSLVLMLRFITGFLLAGIYPVGMKISASWYPSGLGKALGYLVGALVLGTAFPHLLKSFGTTLVWQEVLYTVSILSIIGGLLMKTLVPDGPHLAKATGFDSAALLKAFKSRKFRAAAFGYFGHMWELYAFWAFVPVILLAYNQFHGSGYNVSLWSFLIIASGFIGCFTGGILSVKRGSARIAFMNLSFSGLICLLSPLLFFMPYPVFIAGYMAWGITVVGDSPQFSSLTAQTAPREYVGTGLTIVNCIGFAITIVSVQLCSLFEPMIHPAYLLLFLLPGPIFGLAAISRIIKEKIST